MKTKHVEVKLQVCTSLKWICCDFSLRSADFPDGVACNIKHDIQFGVEQSFH